MLDMVADFLILTKEATDGLGIQYPTPQAPQAIKITESKIGSIAESVSKPLESQNYSN